MSTADYLIELKIGGVWTAIADDQVLEAKASWEISGNRNNAIAFGDDTDASFDARFVYAVWASLVDKLPVRYTTYNSDDGTSHTFTGVVTVQHRTLIDCDVKAQGMKVLIGGTKVYSPMLVRRPIATKTTATSIEDITSGSYAGGLANYALWSCGGRPYEQAASYPSATFYYSCDQAILSSDYAWLAGENTWEELLKLAQASGGQMYQDADGVVRYRQVVGYAGATATDSIGMGDYLDAEESTDPDVLQGNKWTCQYTPRRRLGTQQIAEDTTPYHVESGETVTITIEPQNPIVSLETQAGGTQLKPEALVIARQDGTRIAQGVSGYSHTLDIKAARITITITNNDSKAFTVWKVLLRGDPVVATEAGSASSGSGTIERQIQPSIYIQRRSDAERLCELFATFYQNARANVSIKGCVHKPSRYVGQTILFSCSQWGMTNVPHVILKIDVDDTGLTQDLEIAYVADLPDSSQFYIVGTSYAAGTNKYLGW